MTWLLERDAVSRGPNSAKACALVFGASNAGVCVSLQPVNIILCPRYNSTVAVTIPSWTLGISQDIHGIGNLDEGPQVEYAHERTARMRTSYQLSVISIRVHAISRVFEEDVEEVGGFLCVLGRARECKGKSIVENGLAHLLQLVFIWRHGIVRVGMTVTNDVGTSGPS